MKPVINQIHKLLLKNKKTIGLAESCTGGLLSSLLTSLPGSSKYFILGLTVYSNKAKSKILNIPASLISKKGAVSQEVAGKMSRSIRKLSGADFGIGLTGIAGPGGATADKPVGTVFISLEAKKRKICRRFRFRGSRRGIRKAAALKALELLKHFF